MKKTITLFLVLCLCISLCACAGNSKAKSMEAQKADALILAIGEVSLENQAVILAAKKYYNTLTDEQKAQVENVAIFEAACKELDELLKVEEQKQTYNKALEYEANLQIDEAYAEYEKLPAGYEDAAQRMKEITPLLGIGGTWNCDKFTATSSKDKELGVIFKTINISINSYEDGRLGLFTEAELADSQYVDSSIVAGQDDLISMLNGTGVWGDLTQDGNGTRLLGESSVKQMGFGIITTTYSVTAEGKLIVEYTKTHYSDITTVAFTYSRQQ